MSNGRMKVAGLAALVLVCPVLAAAGFSGCSRPPKFVEGYVVAETGPYSTLTAYPVKDLASLPKPEHGIAGAAVALLSPDTKKVEQHGESRADGGFYAGSGGISDTPGNVHILRVEAPGYVPVEMPVVLNPAAYVIVTLVPEDPTTSGVGVPAP